MFELDSSSIGLSSEPVLGGVRLASPSVFLNVVFPLEISGSFSNWAWECPGNSLALFCVCSDETFKSPCIPEQTFPNVSCSPLTLASWAGIWVTTVEYCNLTCTLDSCSSSRVSSSICANVFWSSRKSMGMGLEQTLGLLHGRTPARLCTWPCLSWPWPLHDVFGRVVLPTAYPRPPVTVSDRQWRKLVEYKLNRWSALAINRKSWRCFLQMKFEVSD